MHDFSQHTLTSLSFAVAAPDRVNLWPAATGDYLSQGRQGRARASEVIEYMEVNDAPQVLGHVIGAMVKQGDYGALEIGFCHQIAQTLMGKGAVEVATSAALPALRLIVDNG